ncbi:hypothetical protein LPB137_00660 [Poseidonibacter parvus]|uniref:Secretin/TonB short N-terminal domain-containing protein n=1 Tax=Poseidonibacter parvus TaxID=1850254 RepID=A0A1P8KIR7_9BACT|nr:hypothetical protein [Poseidonibacter parvus]APW64447.1 hypothetical protein LPB137_00660 [Poseidonibacter parvus]
MHYALRNVSLITIAVFMLTACSTKSYHNEMTTDVEKLVNEKSYDRVRNSYSEELVSEKNKNKEFIDILSDKSLGDVLKELELIDGNFYYLKSSDILVPKSRMKIHNMAELNQYLNAVLDKELFIKKNGSIYLVKLLSTSETKKQSIKDIPFKLNGQISVEELIKLITAESGYEVSIGNYIKDKDDFQNSIVSVRSKNLINAINSLAHAKNVYVDIDYDKEMINIKRYKDVVVELNIPLLNITTTNETSSSETSGESKVENSSEIILYDELDKMMKNIIGNDSISTYHIDKASGLIFMKATKTVESAVRTIAKAYEDSFAREATIVFERIELVLNKSREYGIGSVSRTAGASDSTGVTKSLATEGAISFLNQGATRLLQVTGTIDNQIGKILNYSKNVMVLKNNIPSVQSISQNTDYIEKIETTVNDNVTTSEATVNTIKDGTSITAMAKISRDKLFLNITPNIKKLISISEATVGDSTIQLPEYKDQSYNISREIKVGETSIVGSIIVHDDAKEYEGILPLEGFAIGGSDSKSYVRREIVYVVSVESIKGF